MEKETMELISTLTEIKTKYNLLIDYLLSDADVSYNKDKLRINDCSNILKTLEPSKYAARLNELINETDE